MEFYDFNLDCLLYSLLHFCHFSLNIGDGWYTIYHHGDISCFPDINSCTKFLLGYVSNNFDKLV